MYKTVLAVLLASLIALRLLWDNKKSQQSLHSQLLNHSVDIGQGI